MEIHELESLRWDLRQDCVDIIMAGGGGHIGGDMSVIDALMVLYENHLRMTPTVTASSSPRAMPWRPTTPCSATKASSTSTM